MPPYRYSATDGEGNTHEGELSCDTLAEAISELEAKEWTVGSISLIPDSDDGFTAFNEPSGRTKPVARVSLTGNNLQSHFDSVVARRDELVPALEALSNELPRGTTRRELSQLVRVLSTTNSGAELSRSKHATRWLPLLLTGLTQESATQRLGDLVAMAARETRNRSERRRMLAYPAAVLLITVLVFSLICALIVPPFQQMFEEFGLRLPAPTLFVMAISNRFSNDLVFTLFILAIAALVVFFAVRAWARSGLTMQILGRSVAGNSVSVGAMASLVSQLKDLLSIGVSLPDALWLAGEGCGHRFYQRAAEDLARHVHDSRLPLEACPAAEKLPGNLIYALSAGPGGTPHLSLLHELAAMYADNATHRTSWMTGALAQLSIVLIGLAVGFLVLALFAPLVSLISGLT